MRRRRTPLAFRIRIASIMIAEPAALSLPPVAPCHESKCAPSMTISAALSVPGISATTLNDCGLSSFSSSITRERANPSSLIL